MKTGNISVHSENLFPVIKKFLYSDHEIFLRELVSNATDACQKMKTLASVGDFTGELENLAIKIELDTDKKTLTIRDNGIGMTADEIEKYITQIAFSGAEEFVKNYQENASMIGHFGMGFYSAFMVARKVEIQTLSYKDGSEAAFWECEGETTYQIGAGQKESRGTDIILHLADDAEEFLQASKIRELLNKYARFLPIPIWFEEKQINEIQPLWTKTPSSLQDDDYLAFYKELYPFAPDPLFWIHLNVDYPFRLTGILYFPKIGQDLEARKNKVQLFCNQVYVTDDVKDILPEFLMLLHGAIDSPDIPLNVSRSYLQSDAQVKKITNHITKKVADKLEELFKSNREGYEQKWDGIGLFVKYGLISDEKFAERALKFSLVENTNHQFFVMEEWNEKFKEQNTDKDGNHIILYTNDPVNQHNHVDAAQRKGYEVLLLKDPMIDQHFIQHLEMKLEKTRFKRVDSAPVDQLIEKENETWESVLSQEDCNKLRDWFTPAAGDGVVVKTESLSPESPAVSVHKNEFSRRFEEMAKWQGNTGMFGMNMPGLELIINTNHPAMVKLAGAAEVAPEHIQHWSDLALLGVHELKGERLSAFLKRTEEMLLT